MIRVFRLPDGGWLAVSDRVEADAMGYRLPEPAILALELGADHRVVRVLRPEVWSDCEILGCTSWTVRGTALIQVTWSRLDEDEPRRSDRVVVEGMVAVPAGVAPFAPELGTMLAPERERWSGPPGVP